MACVCRLHRALAFASTVAPCVSRRQFECHWCRAPRAGWQAHVPDQLTELKRDARSSAPRLDFHRQNDPNPARCQRTTVSGRTMASASTMLGARRYNPTNSSRSKGRKTDLVGELRRSTLICCRRTRISASSRPLERNMLVSAVHSNMRTSTIGHEHHPIRYPSPTV
jgi:hypothetical protein